MAQVSAQTRIANIVPRLSLLCLPCYCSLVALTIQVDSLLADFPGSLRPTLLFLSSRVGMVTRRRRSERSFRRLHAKLANSFTHLFFFFMKVRRQVCGRGLIEKVNSFLTSRCLNCPMRQLLFKLFTSLTRHQGPSPT